MTVADPSLILGGRATPGRAEKVEKQRVALLVGALIDRVNGSHDERVGGCAVETIWFHPEKRDVKRSRILPRSDRWLA